MLKDRNKPFIVCGDFNIVPEKGLDSLNIQAGEWGCDGTGYLEYKNGVNCLKMPMPWMHIVVLTGTKCHIHGSLSHLAEKIEYNEQTISWSKIS